jgi:hypothetical protein
MAHDSTLPPEDHPEGRSNHFKDTAVRNAWSAAVLGAEWSTLRIIEDAPLTISIITLIASIIVLTLIQTKDT